MNSIWKASLAAAEGEIRLLRDVLLEARTLIDDYAEEYGHGSFPLIRDKIDRVLSKTGID